MTLLINIFNNGLTGEIPLIWLTRFAWNFPFALCLQLFYVGPLVRYTFRTLFRNQLTRQVG